MPDKNAVIDHLDYFVGLWEEADEYAAEHIPPDIRERANGCADPPSELRGLVIHLAALSDETRRLVMAALKDARDLLAGTILVTKPEQNPRYR